MSERLTDEQVAEGLTRIREEEPKHTCDYEGECWTCDTRFPCLERRWMDLALALQERLAHSRDTELDTIGKFAALQERLQAAEAELIRAAKLSRESLQRSMLEVSAARHAADAAEARAQAAEAERDAARRDGLERAAAEADRREMRHFAAWCRAEASKLDGEERGRTLTEPERAFVHGVLCAKRPCQSCAPEPPAEERKLPLGHRFIGSPGIYARCEVPTNDAGASCGQPRSAHER